MNDFSESLITIFNEAGISLTDDKIELFNRYFNLVIEANKYINLTSITEPFDFALKHILDSVIILKFIDFEKSSLIVDLGSGAGFPGIPLKIMRPDLNMILIDSLNKRVDFLNSTISELNLSSIEALHLRAEEAGQNITLREKADYCLSRAVASLSVLSEYCLPLVKLNGFFISYKGRLSKEELDQSAHALNLLGGSLSNSIRYSLPKSGDERCLHVISKISHTPKKYPRKAGIPSKKPL